EELSLHLDECVRTFAARGVAPDAARAQALAELEDSEALGRALREVERAVDRDAVIMGESRRAAVWSGFWQDLRYAARKLRRTPGFTFVAVATLAIAIGATTSVFSIVNTVLLKPLPFREPGRLVRVASLWRGRPSAMSYLDYVDYRAQSKLIPAMAAFDVRTQNLTLPNAPPRRLVAARVNANFFSVVGVKPVLGRAFAAPDEVRDGARVAMLSEGLWRSTFGGDSSVIGRSITLNANPVTVVGIAPSTIDYPRGVEIWVPQVPTTDDIDPGNRGSHYLQAVGRLAPGATAEQAKIELGAIADRLARQYPVGDASHGETAIPLRDSIVGNLQKSLYVLLGCVGFVLLIACANVANLLLVRAAIREPEIAVRAAMGASRARIIRQLVTESVLLSVGGAVIGTALAAWIVSTVRAYGPSTVPRLDEVVLDGRVLAFSASVALATGVLFGLVPALHAARANLGELLRDGARGSSGRKGVHRTRNALVVAEMALAVILLVGAGLLSRSFVNLLRTEPGYEPENLVTMSVSLPSKKYPWDAQSIAFANTVIEQMRNLPGATHAAVAQGRPLTYNSSRVSFDRDDRPPAPPGKSTSADLRFISADFFRTIGTKIVQGRDLLETDRAGAPQVLIVSQQFAKEFFPNETAIGKHITLGYGWQRTANVADTATVRGEIVGVAADVDAFGPGSAVVETIYVPFEQTPVPDMSILVRSNAAPASVLNMARARLREIDPDLPVYDAMAMTDALSASVAQPRFYMVLLGSFAGVALLLAALGIYGVVSYAVSQRTRELGIRIALGASRAGVTRLVVSQAIMLTATGVVLGWAGAYALTRFVSTMLFGVGRVDATTFVAVAAVLVAVALIASLVPARRAARVDPLIAMRAE
ncbi:MAG: ADOP family duplicated permease, partial [Gemmatimonadaceae bacterium]